MDTSDTSTLQNPISVTVPLVGGDISAGEDLVLNNSSASVLYTQSIQLSAPEAVITCDKTAPITLSIMSSQTSFNQIVSDYNSPWYWSAPTSLQGLAFAYWPHSNPNMSLWMDDITLSSSANTIKVNLSKEAIIDIALAKSGSLTAGVVDGSTLPLLSLSIGQSGALVTIANITFSGSLNISQPTCITPDYTVQLGHWSLERFKTIGSTTPWIDASIRLTGCGIFYGYYNDVPATKNSWSSAGSSAGTPVNNEWSLSLSPVTSIIDSTQGIMAIDDTISGAASGIGIQVSAGTIETANENLVNFNDPLKGVFDTSGGSTVTIPLAARYIQTEDTVSPGTANGKLIYTLSYY